MKFPFKSLFSLPTYLCRCELSAKLQPALTGQEPLLSPGIQSRSLCDSKSHRVPLPLRRIPIFPSASGLTSYHSPGSYHSPPSSYHSPSGPGCHDYTWIFVVPSTWEVSSALRAFAHTVAISGRLPLQRAACLHPSSASSPERPSQAVLWTSASPVPLYTCALLPSHSPSLHPTFSRCTDWLLPASFSGQWRPGLLSSLLYPQGLHIGAEPVKWMTRWSQLVVVHLH